MKARRKLLLTPHSLTIHWVERVHCLARLKVRCEVLVVEPGCCCLAAQSCLTLRYPMDCSPPGISVHGILQARKLEWIAIPLSNSKILGLGCPMQSFSCAKIIYIYLVSILEGPTWTGHCLLFARRIWKLVWTLIQLDHCVSICWSFGTWLLVSWKYMEICRIMCHGFYIYVCVYTHTVIPSGLGLCPIAFPPSTLRL